MRSHVNNENFVSVLKDILPKTAAAIASELGTKEKYLIYVRGISLSKVLILNDNEGILNNLEKRSYIILCEKNMEHVIVK